MLSSEHRGDGECTHDRTLKALLYMRVPSAKAHLGNCQGIRVKVDEVVWSKSFSREYASARCCASDSERPVSITSEGQLSSEGLLNGVRAESLRRFAEDRVV